ncbi:MAG: CusA/CzcA family heavy metal efflux RND transporter [Candidatus Krumholzibacteriia bacterium]
MHGTGADFHGQVLRHRGLVLVLTLLAVVAGTVAWRTLPIDAFPDATNQQVMILTEAEGLGPLDVEQQVTFPIETSMGGLPGVRQVRSLSKTALSQVVVVFEDDLDVYLARQLVFERLQQAREQLPAGVEPELGPISTGLGEVFQYTLASERHDLTELRTIHDWLVAPRLRIIPGVNEINSFGGRVRQVQVLVEPARLLKYGLSVGDVVQAVSAGNANAGGNFIVKAWEQENVRSVGLLTSLDDLRSIVLRAEDGTPVYLSDVARVEEGHMTRLGAATRDGRGETVSGSVIMLKGENAQQVVDRVKAVLPSIEAALPEGVQLDVFYDRTDLIRDVIGTVSGALLQGGLLVILVLFLVVGHLRAAVVAALSLPLTALLVFVAMRLTGTTANLMTLGGLAVTVGMVVDGSIVVTENTLRRLREAPEMPPHGARAPSIHAAAAGEVARPIVFASLIIVLVLLPLFTLEGMEGKMFGPLALTMVFAMLGALLVEQTAVPVLLSYLVRDGSAGREFGPLRVLREGYLRLLERVIERRRVVVGGAVVALAAALLLAVGLGTEFLPELDEGAIAINAVRLPNAGLDGSVATSSFLEREILQFPEVATVVGKTGRAEISEDPMGPEQTDLLIMLKARSEWGTGRSKEELVAAMAERLGRVPGLRLAFSQPIALRVNELISGVKSDLAVKVFGDDLDRLKTFADEAAVTLRGVPGAGDVNVEQVAGFTSLDIVPDRRELARHQLTLDDVNSLVSTAVGGTVATTMVEGRMRYGVRVRFAAEARSSADAIAQILVPTPAGGHVPLGQLAEIRRVEGPAQVSRENGVRRVVVEANVRGRDLGGFVAEAQRALAELTADLPAGYWVEYGGTFASQQRAMRRLSIVVPVSVGLIFLMLVSALGSIRNAGLVLTALPFALVGGVAAMVLLGMDLNVPSTVGFIALFGIAVQNGTVLVAFMEQLRRDGHAPLEAVLTACSLRFRALLMTAATTVLGLAPMLYAAGAGAEVQRPLAVVVIGGLVSATVLTLLVLPALWYGARVREQARETREHDGRRGVAPAIGGEGATGAGR